MREQGNLKKCAESMGWKFNSGDKTKDCRGGREERGRGSKDKEPVHYLVRLPFLVVAAVTAPTLMMMIRMMMMMLMMMLKLV